MLFGYARISSNDQVSSRQIAALKEYCPELEERNIYIDTASGKDFERLQYQELKRILRANDVLYISELDRLGRNKEQIKAELKELSDKGVATRILNLPTTLIEIPAGNEWVLSMVNNILLEVLGAMAEEERNSIKRRQAEGIAIAKQQPGKYLGRKKSELHKDFSKWYKLWKSNGITATQFTELLGYKSRSTLYKMIAQYELDR